MAEGEPWSTERSSRPSGHETQPPARFTEASLVQAARGARRRPAVDLRLDHLAPSRTAATCGRRARRWCRSFTAFAVITLLEQHFPDLVDYAFTARMEDDLDEIASGTAEQMEPWLSRFYFGVPNGERRRDGAWPARRWCRTASGDIDARAVNSIPLGADADGVPIVARVGRYGPYLQRGGDDSERASIPDDLPPDELTVGPGRRAAGGAAGRPGAGVHPRDRPDRATPRPAASGPTSSRASTTTRPASSPRRRRCSRTWTRPPSPSRTRSSCSSLPREVGVGPGRRRRDHRPERPLRALHQEGQATPAPWTTRSSSSPSTSTGACALLAQPKRRGRAAAKPPLKELGPDPDTEQADRGQGRPVRPYVTDGETNAVAAQGRHVEDLTIERALELLADRRARGPVKKKKAAAKKKAPAKKKKAAAKKKAPAKKKKAAAKKKAPAKKAASNGTGQGAPADDPPSSPASDGD